MYLENAQKPTICTNRLGEAQFELGCLEGRKIVFDKIADSQYVHDKMFQTFPALRNCGGHEILRTSDGNTGLLMVVPCPHMGYTVSFLKSALGQAKAFIASFN